MRTYYTILKISPNTAVGDSLSVGLLVCDGNRFWLKISEEKKNVIRRLVAHPDTLDFAIRQLETYVKQLQEDATFSENGLFRLEMLLKSDYIAYVSRYANGLLQFSSPSYLNDEVNDEKIEKLFALLVDNRPVLSKEKTDTVAQLEVAVQTKLIQKVEGIIHTHVTLTDQEVPSMYFKYEMDCIGLNGAFVGAKSVPFLQTQATIDKNISHYMSLITLLSAKYEKDIKKSSFFLIADEPDKRHASEHKIWRDIQVNPLFKVIPSSESGVVAEKVFQIGASTFLEPAA